MQTKKAAMRKNKYTDILLEKAEILDRQGKYDAAHNLLEQATDLEPNNVMALHRLAMLSAKRGNHAKSLEIYLKIIELRPDNLDAMLLLGVEYAETGDFPKAISCFRQCVAKAPPRSGLHQMLGVALAETGQHEEALEQFSTACRINPDDDESLTRLAIELIHFLKMADAEEKLLQALDINSCNPLAHNNLGRVYKFQGRNEEATTAFRKALELEPHNHVVVNNLLLSLNYLADSNPVQTAEEHRLLTQQTYPAGNELPTINYSPPHNPLRIGYVSGDFHSHSVSFFIEPILMHHDPSKISVYCYANDTREDDTTRRLMACPVTWRNIAKLSDQDAALMIQSDEIDILIDLSGHSSENRLGLFSLKPAPLQASWIGYPHSTGLPQMDYYISDALCDPPGMTEHLYSEKIIRLPTIFSCYLPPLQFPQVTLPPSHTTGVITFGSFNNFAKVNRNVIALWGEILLAVPSSRLFLKSLALGDHSTQKQVLADFASGGVSPERIILQSTVNSPLEHLALYGKIDIALDTYPYHGTTTTCEALWMGVPVLTLEGNTHASRVGVSILTSIGCPELIASDSTDYVKKAALLAGDPLLLHTYREKLRSRMAHSPLMDAAGVTRQWEQLCSELVNNTHQSKFK